MRDRSDSDQQRFMLLKTTIKIADSQIIPKRTVLECEVMLMLTLKLYINYLVILIFHLKRINK